MRIEMSDKEIYDILSPDQKIWVVHKLFSKRMIELKKNGEIK